MRRPLGSLLASAALVATAGCGSSSSSTSAAPDSPSPGPSAGAGVLPLISLTGGGGRASTTATLLDTPSHVRGFGTQFRSPALAHQVAAAVARARQSGYLVYGAVVAVGCDRPPGAEVDLDASGNVTITPRPVASPLPECLAPVTTVAVAAVPGAD